MKILFVSAGDKNGLPKAVVRNQGESLSKHGAEIIFFCVKGKGIKSYFSALPGLRREIKHFRPDIVHAHYSFSGYLAALSGARPLVVSLMGSDAGNNIFFRIITKLFIKFYWELTIVKSTGMMKKLGIKDLLVLPNGVDTQLFCPKDKNESILKTGTDLTGKNILFPADPGRPEKNFMLAREAAAMISEQKVNLIPVSDVPNSEMVWHYNAADLLLMTSLWEGSPNVVKEAMSCNLPVVSTDVGDVRELLEGVTGCFICSPDPEDVAEKIREALHYGNKTNGREKIIGKGLDSISIAGKILDLYKEVISI